MKPFDLEKALVYEEIDIKEHTFTDKELND